MATRVNSTALVPRWRPSALGRLSLDMHQYAHTKASGRLWKVRVTYWCAGDLMYRAGVGWGRVLRLGEQACAVDGVEPVGFAAKIA